jgi:hypothetical protein
LALFLDVAMEFVEKLVLRVFFCLQLDVGTTFAKAGVTVLGKESGTSIVIKGIKNFVSSVATAEAPIIGTEVAEKRP